MGSECEKCGVSCFKKPLYRVNPKGEVPAVMMCKECHPNMDSIDKEVQYISEIIVNDNH